METTTQDALVALDLSEVVIETDTPEVAALKAKVKKVAKKYTDRHGWCDEVNRALAEIGIAPPRPIQVNATLHPILGGATITVRVDPTLLSGKTAEQQRTVLVTQFNDLRAYGNGSGNYAGTMKLQPEGIVAMSLGALPSNSGVEWRRITTNGRVLHAVIDVDTTSRWITSVCERASEYRNAVPAANGIVTARCQKCERRTN